MTLAAIPDERYFAERIVPFHESAKGRAEAEQARERLRALAPDGPLLDLGCGPGFDTVRLAESGSLAIGADAAAAGLALASARGARRLVRLDAERLPFRAASFSGVLLAHVLGHLVDPGAGLSEVRRVLRPGARLVVTTPNAAFVDVLRPFNERDLIPYRRDPTVLRYYDAEALEQALLRAGFSVVSVDTFGAAPELPDELEAELPARTRLDDPARRERLMAIACP